jgi:hypothetical protein
VLLPFVRPRRQHVTTSYREHGARRSVAWSPSDTAKPVGARPVVVTYERELLMTACPAFHTSEPETPEVYHDDDECHAGKQILPEHRVDGKGVGRRRCEVCDGLAS